MNHEQVRKIRVRNLSFFYRSREILSDVNIDVMEREIVAIAGPSGSGKSTFLLALNRLWQEIEGARVYGTVEIKIHGEMVDVMASDLDLKMLRRRIAMVFQHPNPLPMSIFKNMSFPLSIAHVKDKKFIRERVERALRQVNLWEEVKDRMDHDARLLSGGQQQRLCLARALVMQPEVLLLDEPTSSLDPKSVLAVEKLLLELKQECTIILVTHYQDQIQRIADRLYRVTDGRFNRAELVHS